MRVFIKKFWGFDPIYWPIVAFSQQGSVTSLIERSQPGDLMAFAGTLGPQTEPHEQGRLLGLAEFGRKPLRSREALPPASFEEAEKGPNGDIKWPHALLITRAWRFTSSPPPMLTEFLGRQLPMAAIANAVLLSDEEHERILALPREEMDVAATEAIWRERDEIFKAVGPGGTMGPIPASFLTKMFRDADQAAVTYAFQFGKRDVWKVGWAHNLADRLAELNKHVPHEVLKEQWVIGVHQKWASADQAYAMEQKVLNAFPPDRRYGERVHCKKEELEKVWLAAFVGR